MKYPSVELPPEEEPLLGEPAAAPKPAAAPEPPAMWATLKEHCVHFEAEVSCPTGPNRRRDLTT